MTLFHLSNLYLTVISVAWAVDAAFGWSTVGWWPW
jgi:protoheme IX farnesyltransferase